MGGAYEGGVLLRQGVAGNKELWKLVDRVCEREREMGFTAANYAAGS